MDDEFILDDTEARIRNAIEAIERANNMHWIKLQAKAKTYWWNKDYERKVAARERHLNMMDDRDLSLTSTGEEWENEEW